MTGTTTIFWDNDGVLVDTEQLYFEATRDVLARAGFPLSATQYVDVCMVQSVGPWPLALAAGFSPDEVQTLRAERDARYAQALVDGGGAERSLVRPDVRAALTALHGRCRMGIVSGAERTHFDLAHERSGLLPFFEFVITGSDCTNLKPDPEPYLRALALTGAGPGSCLAVEDSERGLRSARAAGIRCVILPCALSAGGTFEGAEAVLSSPLDLLQWL